MKDSFEPVCRRCAPIALLPASSKPVRTASSMPNSRNAAMIDTSVRMVRILRRNSAAQIRCRYFMATSSGECLLDQRAFIQMQRVVRVLGGLRIVGDHHDGLAMLAVELPQQPEYIFRGLAIQITGRLI